jgi:hypothetical protein
MAKQLSGRSERVSVALSPDISAGAKEAAAELGVSLSSWLAIAVGNYVRSHRLQREVLERVLLETLGEQLKMELAEMEDAGAK